MNATVNIACLLAIAFGGGIAHAQTGNPAGQPALTPERRPGVPVASAINDADRLFVQQASMGGNAEMELGRLAQRRAVAPFVRAFGERMVAEHGDAGKKLRAIARDAGLPAPDGQDAEQTAVAADLARRTSDFDEAYLQRQLADHHRAAHLYEWEIDAGQNEALKAFARETLPTIFDHLLEVRRIAPMRPDAARPSKMP